MRWTVLLPGPGLLAAASLAGLAEVLFGVFLVSFVVCLIFALRPGHRGPHPPL